MADDKMDSKNRDAESSHESFHSQSLSSGLDAKADAGIKRIEAISLTWTKWSLISAYLG
jgi:hypothetical protein